MLLVPYATFVYTSSLTVAELTDRLAADMETEEPLPDRQPAYRGYLYDGQFELSRIIDYRNPALPRIVGAITNQGPNRHLVVRMQLSAAAQLLLSSWLIVLLFVGISLVAGSTNYAQQLQAAGTVLVFLLSGYAIMLGGFGVEAAKTQAYFRRLSAA